MKRGYIPEEEFPAVQSLLRREHSGWLDLVQQREPGIDQRTRDWHSFINTTGGTIPAWAVMRITGSNAIGDWYEYTVAQPNTTFYRQYLVNGSADVANNARGAGTFLNNAEFVQYDDANTPALDQSWGPTDGSWKLVKNRPGFWIAGRNNTTGTKRTIARQYIVNQLKGKPDANIAKGESGTVSIWFGTTTPADTGMNVTAWATGIAVTQDKFVSLAWNDEAWEVGCWES